MEKEQALIQCDTTKGPFRMRFYREWSPNGYDRAVELFEKNFFDNSHFFRAVPNFLVQFGITYSKDPKLRDLMDLTFPDDPQLDPPIHFDEGIMSFAGSGPDSRSSQMFIAYEENEYLGQEVWETPFGIVESGMRVVKRFYSYGDMPPWGKGPVQEKIYSGPDYINVNFPLIDRFNTCTVKRIQVDDTDYVKDTVPREERSEDEEEQHDQEEEEHDEEDHDKEEDENKGEEKERHRELRTGKPAIHLKKEGSIGRRKGVAASWEGKLSRLRSATALTPVMACLVVGSLVALVLIWKYVVLQQNKKPSQKRN